MKSIITVFILIQKVCYLLFLYQIPDHERKRRRIKYQPEPDDGQVRQLREIAPEHFVYATEQEVPYYAKN